MDIKFIGDERKQCAAQQAQRADQVGIAAAGLVFQPTRVATPVIADLHAAPVSTDQAQPCRCGAHELFHAAEEVACFLRAMTLAVRLFVHGHHSSGVRDVGLKRFDGGQRQFATFDPSVSFLVAGKRGERTAVSLRARRSRSGWLALICNR